MGPDALKTGGDLIDLFFCDPRPRYIRTIHQDGILLDKGVTRSCIMGH